MESPLSVKGDARQAIVIGPAALPIVIGPVGAFISIGPTRLLNSIPPVVTVFAYPVAPEVTVTGPEGLATVYLGIASLEAPGVMIVSQDPPTFLKIPDFALGIGDGGKLMFSSRDVVDSVIELSAAIIVSALPRITLPLP